MAARQQQRGTGLGIQYEDLVPKSEWKDQPEATLLTIDLPGFTKEQIKVTYVHSSKVIRVTGERPLADRRWSRFNEVFTVPQNCIVDKIHGGFKNNVLTITLPKERITKMANLPETSKTLAAPLEKVDKLEEKRLLEESRRKKKEEEEAEQKMKQLLEEKEELIRKLQEDAKAKEMAEARKLQEEAEAKEKAEARKLQEEAEAKEKAEARKLQEEVKAKEKAEARKLQEEAKAKEKAEARKLQEEAKAKEKAEERKLVEEATLAKIQGKKSVDESGGKEKIQKAEERKLPEVVYTKSGVVSVPKSGSGGVGEVVKSAEEKIGNLVEKEKKMGKGIMEKIRRKEITSEEKKLIVNVGVAALVIFALGAYVSYTFCSSSPSSSCSSPCSSSSSTKPE